MAEIATLKAVFDSTDLKKGAAEGRRAIEELADSAKKTDAAMAILEKGGARLLALFGVYKFAQWVKGSSDLAARYETLGVVLNQVSSSAGYASTQVSKLTSELQKQGISMLQSRQTVISMIQAKLDLAKADQLAAVAQNAAVTAGLNSSETLQRIVFGITSSQTEVLRTVGLTVQFDEAYRNLAATLHKGVDSLTAQEKSQARVNAVLEAGKPIAGAYGAAMDTAGKQAKSMERYTEDLRVKIGQAFQPANTAAIASMAFVLKTLADNTALVLAAMGILGGQTILKVLQTLGSYITILREGAGSALATANADLQLAKSKGILTEASIASANAQKVELQAKLADLQATRAAIVAAREEAIAKRQAALASAMGPNPTAQQLAPLGGAVVAREMARQEATRSVLQGTMADLAQLGQQQTRVEKQIANTTGAVNLLTNATSLGTRATAGLTTVYNALGGALGIGMAAVSAFYLVYSQSMQKAKEEINENSEAIKKKLVELTAAGKSALGQGAGFDSSAMDGYNKQLRAFNSSIEESRERVLGYGVSFTESIKGVFTNGGKFLSELNTLNIGLRTGQFSATEMLRRLDTLEAKYPEMATSVQKAREEVAMLAIKQEALNKFLTETPTPLLAAAKAMDVFALAAAKVDTSKFMGPQLGEKGADLDRQAANLLKLQAVIRTGNKEAIEGEKARQEAAETTNKWVEEQIKKSTSLSAVQGKSFEQIMAMGPVADKEVAQLQVSAAALYKKTLAVSDLNKANEKASGMADRLRTANDQQREFLDQYRDVTSFDKFQRGLDGVARSMKQSGLYSDSAVAAYRKQAEELFRQKTMQDLVAEAVNKRNEGIRILNGLVSQNSDVLKANWEKARDVKTAAEENILRLNLERVAAMANAKERRELNRQLMIEAETRRLMENGGKNMQLDAARDLATRTVDAQLALADANKQSAGLAQNLANAFNAAAGIATVLGKGDLSKAFSGAGNVLGGIQQINNVRNGNGGLLGAFRDKGENGQGLAGFTALMGGVGSIVSVVGGLVEQAKQKAKEMKAAAEQFGQSMDDMRKKVSEFANSTTDQLASFDKWAKDMNALADKATSSNMRGQVAPGMPGFESFLQKARETAEKSSGHMAVQQREYVRMLEEAAKTYNDGIKKITKDFITGINDSYAELTGDSNAGARTKIENEFKQAMGALDDLRSRDLVSTQEYADTKFKIEETERIKLLRLAEQTAREKAAFGLDADSRLLEATGRGADAEDMRRSARYEEELRVAREKGYDVAKLLAAQEAENARVLQDRADKALDAMNSLVVERARLTGSSQAADDMEFQIAQAQRLREAMKDTSESGLAYVDALKELQEIQRKEREEAKARAMASAEMDLRTRELRASGQDILAQLSQSEKARNDEMYNAEKLYGADSPYVKHLRKVLDQEKEFEKKGMRDSFDDRMADFETNPILRAQREAKKQLDEARNYAGQLLDAGIITEEEYARYINAIIGRNKKAIDELEYQRKTASDNLDIQTLGNIYNRTGKQQDNAAFISARRAAAARDALKGAQDLLDAGTITQEQFDKFKDSLVDLNPALRDAASAAEAAAAAFRATFSDLQGQWDVFGTNAEDRLKNFTNIFTDFGNMSRDDALKLYRKVGPGTTLTQEDRDFNERIRTYIKLLDDRDAAAKANGAGEGGGSSGSSAGGGDFTSSSWGSVTEATTLRMIDVETSQLSVLQRIESKIGGEGGITVQITVTGSPLVAQTPRQVATEIAAGLLPILDEYAGRKVGLQKKFTGETSL